ncbi:MAG: DUF4440 domain-containing protein [Oligoflexia bacterium]|nr:DUF4440 domain-containing protein [Oligoflexia bacterium]
MQYENLFELERKLLESSVRKNRAELEKLLCDSFLEFGTSGRIWNKQSTITSLAIESPATVAAMDFKSVELANGVVLVTYKTKRKNEDGSLSASLRSSIWKLYGSQWKILFHQGTGTDPN